MNKNLMPEVAELLGVEIGETFYILQNGKHKCVEGSHSFNFGHSNSSFIPFNVIVISWILSISSSSTF